MMRRHAPVMPPLQRGFSLVELMVAMVVSLLLLLGIIQILLGNKDSYRTQNDLATLHQNARLTRFVMENGVAHAGYLVDLETTPNYFFRDGFISDDPDNDLSYAADSDSLTIRYQSDGAMNNCLGSEVNEGQVAHFTLYVDQDDELQCAVYDNNGEVGNVQPLVNDVVLMKVRFGLDSDPDDNHDHVDFYTNDLSASQRDQVRSVRVQLVLRSDTRVRTEALDQGFAIAGYNDTFMPGYVYDPSAGQAAGTGIPDAEYYAYEMVDQVIALRNLLP